MTNKLSFNPDYWRYFAREAAKGGDCPLYELFALAIAEDVELQAVSATAQPGQPPANMLFAAVHFALLAGAEHALRRYYGHLLKPGEALEPVGPSAFAAFRDFVARHRAVIDPLIATRVTNTNEVRRSVFLRAGYAVIAAETGKPLNIIELGPSAGLNLNWDRYACAYRLPGGETLHGGPASGLALDCEVRGEGVPPVPEAPPVVAARIGLELNPVDLASEADRRWLVALLWPGQPDRIARMQGALAIAADHPPPIRAGDALALLPSLLAAADPAHATVIVHSLVTYQWTEAMRAALDEGLLSVSRRSAVYRLSAEFRIESEWDYPLRLDVYDGGAQESRILAGVHHHGAWIDWRAVPGR